MSIGQLAEAAGVSRRAVRFYVQRGLLEPPEGRGRGSSYSAAHLDRLRRIQALQEEGHSLEAVRRILAGQAVAPPPAAPRGRGRGRGPEQEAEQEHEGQPRQRLMAQLWTRLPLAEGLELHYDPTRVQPSTEELLEVRRLVRALLGLTPGPEQSSAGQTTPSHPFRARAPESRRRPRHRRLSNQEGGDA